MLTDKQKVDLETSIYDYLISVQYDDAAAALKDYLPASDLPPPPPLTQSSPSTTTLLEKKWVSVVRLQKKVMELEAQLKVRAVSEVRFKRISAKLTPLLQSLIL
jgi:platelet-activating factor acetylhydrolase IB subunit alpha